MNSTISNNIAAIRERIRLACESSQRPLKDVRLMAVSKTRSAADIAEAIAAGITDIGENYLQEALRKKTEVDALGLKPCWHFIGPIQSNKTRDIANQFDWVHSVDRAKIARRLSEQRPTDLPPLNICIQVNINLEASKSGVAPNEVAALLTEIAKLPQIQIRGLMAIPEASDAPQTQHLNFAKVRLLRDQLQQQFPQLTLDTLSMGMSGDMDAAIAEGATMVRIGSDIFGARG
ncbi:YggS family pyridoxal phosphate-dependent enzyme [Spongiibacter sp. KMU-158]|uniref:Pyridoxal phosphate homeostasis protein n=1 Tax=Spongiibacter pelagi TaxID=2760804 RepID=A0A927C075_9GAMM|nr:YggS family pyridoxal phosphate-dependent enzyme [Spongiibacter pelagi]MBD2857391.1 YggS family pyridoxal phosphate-dependent enzyme [Spongiibacter pelagi]